MSDAFADLHAAAAALGTKLFTVTLHDPEAHLFRRAYTSHSIDYPTSGTKPMVEDDWSRRVIGEGKSFVANTTAGFAPFFPDFVLINALGCNAAMNIPVKRRDGAVVGTVNLLAETNHFTPEKVDAYEALVDAQTPALLQAIAATPLS